MIADAQAHGLLSSAELEQIEKAYPDGTTSQQVVSLFQSRGIKLSEATFRKYVQLGLLPTSKRVGQKGKHRGSRGLYPVGVFRRINLIKQMMDQGLTLEEIRESFLSIRGDLEALSGAIEKLFADLDARIERLEAEGETVAKLDKEISTARSAAESWMKRVERIGSRLAVTGSDKRDHDQGGMP
ncbi:MAG: MerR family transcriptional regulator [Deltaproteobacteria bacterium]|nr:MerR family transcriptional regulator [Deltaproteobacteria bacterium]